MDVTMRVIFDNKDMKLDETALTAPVKVYGKPIGFINGVTENTVSALLWTSNIIIERGLAGDDYEEGEEINMDETKIIGLELCGGDTVIEKE